MQGVVLVMFEGYRVLGFDLETTGISVKRDRIVQFGLVGSDKDGEAIYVEELVHPQQKIPIGASEVHGIFDKDVCNSPAFAEHYDRICKLVENSIIVGHNVNLFDWKMLEMECLRIGRKCPEPLAIIDTLTLARKLKLPRSHKLGVLCNRYGVSLDNAHTAGADAAASLLLLWKISNDFPAPFRKPLEEIVQWLMSKSSTEEDSELGKNLFDLEPLDSEGRLRKNENQIIIAFGRHKGLTLKQVWNKDRNYVNWLISPAANLPENIIQIIKERVM